MKTGALTLGPFTASAVVVLPGAKSGRRSVLPAIFQSGRAKTGHAGHGIRVSVESLPLPTQNQPANFTGAVGNFTMTATAGPTTVTVGDPITVRVQISGRGALDALTLPPQDAWHDFKTYPPTTKLDTSDQFGFQGTKTFEQIISPQNSDVHELPALTFSFFNPDDGQYHTLTQPAVPLVVKAAGATPMPTLAATKNSAPENQPPQDILPIKENLGTAGKSRRAARRAAGISRRCKPCRCWRFSPRSSGANARTIWRTIRACAGSAPSPRSSPTAWTDLKKFAAANQPDEFFATLFRLLQEQLGERLDCPASAITENVVEEHPVLRGASPATAGRACANNSSFATRRATRRCAAPAN